MSNTVRAHRVPGGVVFAAIVLITGGIMRVFDAIWAFDKNDEVREDLEVWLFEDDLAAYGWLWLIVGGVLIAAGIGVLSGSRWARWVGIAAAALAAISAMLWVYQYPIWSLIYVSVALFIIRELLAEGYAAGG